MDENQEFVLSFIRKFASVILLVCMFAITRGHAQTLAGTMSFARADSIAALYPNHSIEDLRVLASKLTASLNTEPEKFRAIFKWVCDNIRNDYELYQANKKKRERLSGDELRKWNKDFNAVVFEKLRKSHATVCTGYAYLIREMSHDAGLSCEIVNGYGRNVVSNIGGNGILNHSWNAVKLDDTWYLCDATWASGSIDTQRKSFVRKYSDVYFLADPDQFINNHYPQDLQWSLIDHAPSLSEFLNAPLAYAAAIREHVNANDPMFDVTVRKGDRLKLSLDGPSGLSKRLAMVVGESRVSGQSAAQTESGNRVHYQLSQVFYFKGTYAVHILLNDEYLYSYRVLVK